MIKITEMAYSRQDAIIYCNGIGVRFIEHFHKIYNNPNSEDVPHWISKEMQPWWNSVQKLILKQNKKHLTKMNMMDWFFTAGSDVEEYMENPNPTDNEIECYGEFVIKLLSGKSVKQALVDLGIIKDY